MLWTAPEAPRKWREQGFRGGNPGQEDCCTAMASVTLHGARYSVYTRIARLAMEEAGLDYHLEELDIFDKEALPAGYLERHPFSKIPALEHEGFRLFETDAIVRYALDLSGNRELLPEAPRDRARCLQVQRIVDNYAYPTLVWGVFVEERDHGLEAPLAPEVVERARLVLKVLQELRSGPWFLGQGVTLADLWVAPVLVLFRMAPTGQVLLAAFPELIDWLEALQTRPSMRATRFPREEEAAC